MIQTIVSKFAVEAFDEGILGRLSWLEVMKFDTRTLGPETESVKENKLVIELGQQDLLETKKNNIESLI